MIERGERAVDRRSLIVALANALEVAPSDLTALPMPAPGNGESDSAVNAARRALMAVHRNRPGGQILPVDALRIRMREVLDAGRQCQQEKVGAALAPLIRDLHTSIAAGRDVAEMLELAVVLHTRGTDAWLRVVGARVELRSLATLAARQAAETLEHPTALGLAAWGDAQVTLAAGDFDLARAELDTVSVPTDSSEAMQLHGMLALSRSLVAASDNRSSDVESALDYATDLAEHTGEGNAYWLGFGPTNVGFWRMASALEAGDYDLTVRLAHEVDPRRHANRSRQAAYWIDYGRALAHTRGRRDDAVMALRQGEKLSPLHVLRNPLVREVMAELMAKAKRDAVGRELRGMAYRAGLPV